MTTAPRRARAVATALCGAALLLTTTAPAGAAGRFDDDDYNAHEPNIEAVAGAGVTEGCGGDDFCPNQRVTRGQMATCLVRALDIPSSSQDAYSDDDGTTHEDNINALSAAGITGGCGGDGFCPNQLVTRAHMATFLVRGLDLPPASRNHFTDDNGSAHEDNINALAESRVSGGCGTTTFCPDASVTRSQMASFLTRGLGLSPKPVGPYVLKGLTQGVVTTAGQRVAHQFEVSRPSVVTHVKERCAGVSSSGNPDFVLSDEAGRQVDIVGGTLSGTEVFEVESAGRYTLTLQDEYRAGYTYCFSLYDVTDPHRFELSIGQFVTATGPNGAQPDVGAGRLGISGERDVYSFAVTRASRIAYAREQCAGRTSGDPTFDLSDSDGRQVDVVGGTLSGTETFELPTAGTYSLTTRNITSSGYECCFTLTDVTDTAAQ